MSIPSTARQPRPATRPASLSARAPWHPPHSGRATAGSVPFVGRAYELERIEQLLEQATAGSSCGLFLLGHTGSGKSALLTAARELAAARGVRTGCVSCLPLGASPFDVVFELLRTLGESHECTGPASGSQLCGASASQLFGALVEQLIRASRESPLLVCLDDFHWSDQAAVELIHCCLVRLRDLPLAWLFSGRISAAQCAVAYRFERAADLPRLQLGSFSPSEVLDLSARIVAPRARERLAHIVHARAGGHPQLTVELLQGLAGQLEAAVTDDEACRAAATVVPAGVSEAVGTWLSTLSLDARLALEWSAALRSWFREDDLQAVMERPAGRALDELVEAGLLNRREARWTFRRALVRDAVNERLGVAERARRRARVTASWTGDGPIGVLAELEQAADWRAASRAYLELAEKTPGVDAEDVPWLIAQAHDLALRAADPELIATAAAGRVLALEAGESSQLSTPAAAFVSAQLSARETQVVELIAAGHTNTEIATDLCVSPKTVERHVSNILAKLGFRSRVQVAAAAASGSLAPHRMGEIPHRGSGAGPSWVRT